MVHGAEILDTAECALPKASLKRRQWSRHSNPSKLPFTLQNAKPGRHEQASQKGVATGASEPQNMMYMRRVGSYGFADMKEMITSLNKLPFGPMSRLIPAVFCDKISSMHAPPLATAQDPV
eukprot:1141061-Pelagomonas_calceolata.AAC.6